MSDQSGDSNQQSGGRTLGGGSAEPLPENWTRPTSQPRIGRIGQWSSNSSGRTGRIAGLSDLAPSAPPRRRNNDDDDDEDGDSEGEPQSFFAGGERSGISVEGPPRKRDNLVKDILKKAARGGPPTVSAAPSGPRAFAGSGNTLGSDEVESQFIPDPSSQGGSEEPEESVDRSLIFWRDGFSVEDGPLYRYGVPENEKLLKDINSGLAPPSVMNVRIGQPVQIIVSRRTNEDYVAPKRSHTTFGGSGQRLGSPVPNIAGSGETGTATQSIPGSFPTSGSVSPAPAPTRQTEPATRFEVDFNEATTSVQVRLADGTRLTARMNLTHTVGDIRNFINASRSGSTAQAYTIGTTFPNRTLDDDSVTIEKAGLKNCVIVQRLS